MTLVYVYVFIAILFLLGLFIIFKKRKSKLAPIPRFSITCKGCFTEWSVPLESSNVHAERLPYSNEIRLKIKCPRCE